MNFVPVLVSPILTAVIPLVTSMITERYQLLQGVEGDIGKLKNQLSAIQSVLEDAEEKQLDNPRLRDWLGKLKEAACDAEDVLRTFEVEARLRQREHDQVKKLLKLKFAREIKDILARIDQIAGEKNNFDLNENGKIGRNIYESKQTTPYVVEADVVGRKDDKSKVIELLLSEEFDREGHISVLSVVGMGGLGKTTLAQLVFIDDTFIKHFECKIWVCVTVNYDYRETLKRIIEYRTRMSYDITSLSGEQLETRVLDLLKGQKFFLVLDDVWIENFEEWDKLQRFFKQGGKGSRVLITTRSIKVSERIGTQSPYHLDCLPEDHGWSLFQKIAFTEQNNNVRSHLEGIGLGIVRKCNGLPLAIRAMGGVLRGSNDKERWENILKPEFWQAEADNGHGKPIVLPALKLSYDHLPSHLKQCFAYCHIFPKAHVFDKSELVKIWKAQSFLQHDLGGHYSTLDEIGRRYFDELCTKSFFQNIDNNLTYKMHDLYHDLAQSISIPYCYQVKDLKSGHHISERSRHVSLLCQANGEAALKIIDNAKKLRTLVLPTFQFEKASDLAALDQIFRRLKYLRMLDLSSSALKELPNSVEELKLLHYLDLSRTEIRALPNSICNLYNLQTLKLLGCVWLFQLPKDFGNLVNLEHLELDDMFWFKLSILPPKMGSLTSLQNLHTFKISHESGYEIDELKGMNFLKGNLHISQLENAVNAANATLGEKENLQKLVLEWSNMSNAASPTPRNDVSVREEKVLKDLTPHSNLKELQIICYMGTRFPIWIEGGLLQNLVKLYLNRCSKCTSLSLGKLECLRELYIKGMLELQEWEPEHEAERGYLYLGRLEITNCPKLIKLPTFFPRMVVLKIKKCDSLKSLPLTPTLQFSKLVNNPILDDWNEKLLRYQGRSALCSFSNLLELKIINCPKIQALPEFFAPQKLEIVECPMLNTLPVPHLLRRLQCLAVDGYGDGALLRAIPETNSLYSLAVSNTSGGLSRLPNFPHLSGLVALYIHNCSNLVYMFSEEEASLPPPMSMKEALPILRYLSISDCAQLVALPEQGLPTAIEGLSIGSCRSLKSLGPPENMLKNLTSLKDLYISECPALESLPEEGLPISLQHLQIEGCPLLLEQCRKDSGPDWSKIKHIPDLQIESSPSTSMNASPPAWFHRFVCCKGIDTQDLKK